MKNKYGSSFPSFFNKTVFLSLVLGFTFLNGILNMNHLLPSNREMYIHLQMTAMLSICLFGLSFIDRTKKYKFGASSFIWLSLLIIVIIQPLINEIVYVDALIFPIFIIILMLFVNLVVINIENKEQLVKIFASFIFLGSILHLLTHYAHLFRLTDFYGSLVLPIENSHRPIGNVGQPNQAAFIYSLAIATIIFFYNNLKHKKDTYLANTLVYFFIACLASGIAISSSRSGLVMGVFAIIVFLLHIDLKIKERISQGIFLLTTYGLGYVFGLKMLSLFSNELSAVSRIVQKTDAPFRIYQFQQAWMTWKDEPITGIGWGNFVSGGLKYAEHIPWFSFGDHSHFLLSHIASELGLIGLIIFVPLTYVLLKNLNFRMSQNNSLAYSIVLLTLLYSCFEFPLWYIVYLLVFNVFVSLLDTHFLNKKYHLFKISFILLIMLCGSVYYLFQYKKYSNAAYTLKEKTITYEQKVMTVQRLKPVFGMTMYQDMLTFLILKINDQDVPEKLKLGNRVINQYTSPFFLLKQSGLLAYDNQKEKSLVLLKSACLFHFASECNSIHDSIKHLSTSDNASFRWVYHNFAQWRKDNPERTGLTIKSK